MVMPPAFHNVPASRTCPPCLSETIQDSLWVAAPPSRMSQQSRTQVLPVPPGSTARSSTASSCVTPATAASRALPIVSTTSPNSASTRSGWRPSPQRFQDISAMKCSITSMFVRSTAPGTTSAGSSIRPTNAASVFCSMWCRTIPRASTPGSGRRNSRGQAPRYWDRYDRNEARAPDPLLRLVPPAESQFRQPAGPPAGRRGNAFLGARIRCRRVPGRCCLGNPATLPRVLARVSRRVPPPEAGWSRSIAEASARDPFYAASGFDAAYDWTDALGRLGLGGGVRRRVPICRRFDESVTLADPATRVFRFLNNNDTGDRFITSHGEGFTRVATAMLLTLPGLPCLYLGDEVGASFQPYAQDDPIAWEGNQALREHTRRLIAIRHELPGLAGRRGARWATDGDSALRLSPVRAQWPVSRAGPPELQRHVEPLSTMEPDACSFRGRRLVRPPDRPGLRHRLGGDPASGVGSPGADPGGRRPVIPTERPAVTIKDIAARAGVSISTVSRVVNQTVRVDPATEQRVHEAIEALGYRPNLLARSFRRQVTQTIGLIVPDNSNPYFAEICPRHRRRRVRRWLQRYPLQFRPLQQQAGCPHRRPAGKARRRHHPDLNRARARARDAGSDIQRIQQAGVPCVVVDRDLGDAPIDQLMVDNHEGGYLAARYLIDQGTPGPCLCRGSERPDPKRRPDRRVPAGAQRGRNRPPPGCIGPGQWPLRRRRPGLPELLRRNIAFSAIFAFNDQMAIGVIGALQRAGLSVPERCFRHWLRQHSAGGSRFPRPDDHRAAACRDGRNRVCGCCSNESGYPTLPPRRVEVFTHLLERESVAPFDPARRQTYPLHAMPNGKDPDDMTNPRHSSQRSTHSRRDLTKGALGVGLGLPAASVLARSVSAHIHQASSPMASPRPRWKNSISPTSVQALPTPATR